MKTTNTHLKLLLCFTVLLICYSCKKEIVQTKEETEYTQYFSAVIGSKSITIQNSLSKDRSLFKGSWTGVGMSNWDQIEMYTIKTILPKEALKVNAELNFQIFDIKKNTYHIDKADFFEKSLSTYIYLKKYDDFNNETIYSANKAKKPFEIKITKYDFPNESLTPVVRGTLSGVLYNVKDLRDSITIKNGDFEVRY
ncbi:DUF5025 domain-containing protein [Pedobacter sp. N36a]|uniref:DUF5025 domain-containing protein n=1 Tax=Pedobacter sp. N36a TaxID=2767996 RepID=UPI00165709DF|nr:DUF5025 domain-containing protein [Pedobacter sp. N36a]MBC8986705.1 DUF5025 domain-containing protein [Pedobacter sp. N36a]